MLGFLEKNLKNKILLAELFYISRGNYSDKEVCDEIGISLSTLRLYEKEVQNKFEQQKKNGTLYNSNALLNISNEYIKESVKVKLFELFIFFPGEHSSFYKEKLNLSDATFSRIVRKLRTELKKYEIRIIVKNGYYFESDKELNVILLMTHAGKFFNFSFDRIHDQIALLQKDVEESAMNMLNQLEFTYCQSKFEQDFFRYLNSFLTLRYLQNEHYYGSLENSNSDRKKITLVYNELENHYFEAERKINEKFSVIKAELEKNKYEYTNLKKLLISAMFQIDIFPYKIRTISLRLSFFVKKFEESKPEEYVTIQSFLYRVNRLMRTDFFKRKDILFFFLLSESFFMKKNKTKKFFYIFSSLNEKHAQILFKQISPIASFFGDVVTFEVIDNLENIKIDNDNKLISTEFCDRFSKNSQFLISDYISLQEIVQIGLWIKETTVF